MMSANTTTRSITFSAQEETLLTRVSKEENLPEHALLKKFVLDGLSQWKLVRACQAYKQGEISLSGAANYAGINVERMMDELERSGGDFSPSFDQFLNGLDSLLDVFGEDKEARRIIARMRELPPT